MRLSIIVPVYNMNHDNMLSFCLDSLVNQTIEDYEIIAVDDASTDDSLDMLKEYQSKYPNLFKIISYPDNRKQGGAKNEGLKAASGEWIGFIDSDDWIAPNFYEKLLGKAEATGADVVGCQYNIVHEHTFEIGETVINNTPGQCGVFDTAKRKEYLAFPGSMVIKIYKHSLIKENNLSFPEGIFYEDNCAAPIWCMYFKHFELVDEPLYYYFQHQASTVHKITASKCHDRMTAMETMLSEMKSRGFYEEYKDELEDIYTRIYFINTLFSYMSGDKEEGISLVKELRNGILREFPAFRNNPQYKPADEEERKMIDLCIKSPLRFYNRYNLIWFIRKHK